jgi:hypothetical protein
VSNGSVVITIIPKAKYQFHAATSLFYTVQNIAVLEVAYFLKSIYYHTQFWGSSLNGCCAVSSTQVHVSAMLLTIVRKEVRL